MLIGHVIVFNPTDKSCLHFSFDFMGFYCYTCINFELIRNRLWQPRFHAGILMQEMKSAVFGIMGQISMGSISNTAFYVINYHYKITEIVRVVWLVKNLWFIIPVNP